MLPFIGKCENPGTYCEKEAPDAQKDTTCPVKTCTVTGVWALLASSQKLSHTYLKSTDITDDKYFDNY